MAVPVDGVRYILEAILKTFANVKYESIESNTEIESDDLPETISDEDPVEEESSSDDTTDAADESEDKPKVKIKFEAS